jgi:hypothetical protein
MKDHADTSTVDFLGAPRRRGPKPKPDSKTPAERQREYRLRKKAEIEELKALASTLRPSNT